VKNIINSHDDYIFFLEADRLSLKKQHRKPRFGGDEIWKFQRMLRKLEYLKNCQKNAFDRLLYLETLYRFHRLSVKLGFTIPPNTFGPGLSIAHRGTIVVNDDARIGENCRIFHCTTIGSHDCAAPVIGNNVFVGAGAVIVGNIHIADGIAIGANSFVNKSFNEPNISIAGCPAQKISDQGSEKWWIRSTELLRQDKKM
jgi:serine O-acetyltransferase